MPTADSKKSIRTSIELEVKDLKTTENTEKLRNIRKCAKFRHFRVFFAQTRKIIDRT